MVRGVKIEFHFAKMKRLHYIQIILKSTANKKTVTAILLAVTVLTFVYQSKSLFLTPHNSLNTAMWLGVITRSSCILPKYQRLNLQERLISSR